MRDEIIKKRKEYAKKYRKEHLNKIKEYQKKYWAEHGEEINAKRRNRKAYKYRCNKAIEYIKERYDYILKSDFLDHDEQVDKRQITYLLNILQGEDKDE